MMGESSSIVVLVGAWWWSIQWGGAIIGLFTRWEQRKWDDEMARQDADVKVAEQNRLGVREEGTNMVWLRNAFCRTFHQPFLSQRVHRASIEPMAFSCFVILLAIRRTKKALRRTCPKMSMSIKFAWLLCW